MKINSDQYKQLLTAGVVRAESNICLYRVRTHPSLRTAYYLTPGELDNLVYNGVATAVRGMGDTFEELEIEYANN